MHTSVLPTHFLNPLGEFSGSRDDGACRATVNETLHHGPDLSESSTELRNDAAQKAYARLELLHDAGGFVHRLIQLAQSMNWEHMLSSVSILDLDAASVADSSGGGGWEAIIVAPASRALSC
jgi:hypothetical protein